MEHKRSDAKRYPFGAALQRPAVTDALQRALFQEWALHGYRALSLERVAARAGVGKAALYRRWSSKTQMVADALATVSITITEVPDSGALQGDIQTLLKSVRRVLRHPLVRRILPDIHAERSRSGELGTMLAQITFARRARGVHLIERAITRGELSADVDIDIALDLLVAAVYWRIVITQGAASSAYLDRLSQALAAALRAC